MEDLELTTPVVLNKYRVMTLLLDWGKAEIRVWVKDPQDRIIRCGYDGAIATTIMTQLNKANLSNNSLHKRILERLRDDGQLPPGNVTGSPD